MGYGRYGSRSNYTRTTGRVDRVNKRPGNCHYCAEEIPAGAGQLWREDSGAWSVVHIRQEWTGSPVSGQYVGGCPADTDKLNRDGARSEYDAIKFRASLYASRNPATPARTYTPRRGKCIDAPCCGCCDA